MQWRPCRAVTVIWGLFLQAKPLPPRASPEHVFLVLWFLATEETHRRFRALTIKQPLLRPDTAAEELTQIVPLLWRDHGAVHRFGGGQLVDASCGLNTCHVASSVSRFFSIQRVSDLA